MLKAVDFDRTLKTSMKRTLCLLVIAAIASIGCNLATNRAATLAANPTITPAPFATAAPQFQLPPTVTPILGTVLATALPGVAVPTPLPGSFPAETIPAETQNAIEWVISQMVIPAWNFVYTLVINGAVALWIYAGDRGGLTAQLCGCVLPTLVAGVLVARAALRRIRML